MFGIKKKRQTDIADDLYEFLLEADKRYIRAFETRSIGLLKDYFTRDCCMAISRWIVAEASSRYFSEERFRETTWKIEEQTSTQIVLRKQCVYKNVKLAASRYMKISDDYTEEWSVSVSPDEYWVTDVRAIEQVGGI